MVITINNKPLIEPYTLYIQDISFEAFMDYAEEDIACELLDGVLVIHSPASYIHESIFSFLISVLKIFGTTHELGKPIGSRFIMKLSSSWAPEPDIMFLTKDDIEKLHETYLDGPASIVFEILSKSTRSDDISKKLPIYLASGVKEAWFIDSENETISIHWPDGEEVYTGDSRATSKILPGFWIRGSWLWTPDAMPVTSALDEIERSNQ